MSYKIIAFFSLIVLSASIFLYQEYQKAPDGKLHIIFCDVGQGDGIIIRTPKGSAIVYDGGPNDQILSCLSSHIPLWQRTISFVAMSHPHADHFVGLIGILKRYRVNHFITEKLTNAIPAFEVLQEEIVAKEIPQKYLYRGDRIKTKDGVVLTILSPTKEFLKSSSPGNSIGESKEFANLITLVSYGSFSLLLPGDSQANAITQSLQSISPNISVIQVPHHGSATGLSQEIFNSIHPSLAVISVGLKNRYGHPASSTLKLLKDNSIKILRTDQNGDIEIVSDGKRWNYF